jgi:predicted dinucleotide-binding enzyme
MANPVYPQGPVAMVYAGSDAHANEVAARLAADLGFEPLALGPISSARYIEPMAMVWIRLALVQKMGRGIAFGLMRR